MGNLFIMLAVCASFFFSLIIKNLTRDFIYFVLISRVSGETSKREKVILNGGFF